MKAVIMGFLMTVTTVCMAVPQAQIHSHPTARAHSAQAHSPKHAKAAIRQQKTTFVRREYHARHPDGQYHKRAVGHHRHTRLYHRNPSHAKYCPCARPVSPAVIFSVAL